MKLLTQLIPQVQHLVRRGGWFTPAVAGAVIALEVFGRQWPNDLYDLAGLGILGILLGAIAIRHKSNPLPWVHFLGRMVWNVARWSDRWKMEFGPDLRGTPPIPRRVPFSVHFVFACVILWCTGCLLLWWYLPEGWRQYAVQGSYVLYLAVIGVLWGAMFAGLLAGIYFPFMLFNQIFPRSEGGGNEPRMSRGQLGFLVGYLSAVIIAYWYIPLWIGPALGGVCLLILLAISLVPRAPGIQFIWRTTGTRRVWSIPTPRLLLISGGLAVLMPSSLIATAAGGHLLNSRHSELSMPITTMLGIALAWLTPGILLAGGTFVWLFWRQNPSRTSRVSVYVEGSLVAAVRPQLRTLFRAWDYELHTPPEGEDEIDVRLRLVEPIQSEAREFAPTWPLRVSLEDLHDGLVRERIERRDEIQRRRLLMRGLQRIFKAAAKREFSHGCGYWLAPHLWFMPGMTRDEMGDDEGDAATFMAQMVGPPYQEVMHRSVREYAYRLLRALNVDLIFVEDGVDFRKLKKVLRVMFEIFDKSAGTKRAEDIHFLGLPKVKVMIHEFNIDDTFRSETYPEPRFDDLGRARILHIFRDRGEDEELLEPPFDFSSSPVPLYA